MNERKEKNSKKQAEVTKVGRLLRTLWKSLLFVVSATVIGAGTVLYLFFNSSHNVILPDLTNMTQKQAIERLSDKGFNSYKIVETDATNNIDKIAWTSPAAGSVVKNNSDVVLYVNTYKGSNIGNFKGKSLDEVLNTLTNDLDLPQDRIKVEYVYDGKTKAGQVLKQSKEKNVNLAKDTITLTVSKGPQFIKLENPVDKTFEDVQKSLLEQGILAQSLEVTYTNDSTIATGKVISMTTENSDAYDLAQNKPIKISVSNGTEIPTVTIPDLKGQTYAQALAALTALGINAQHISYSGVESGTVESQTVPANQLVDKNNVYLTLNMTPAKSTQEAIDMIDLNSLKGLSVNSAQIFLINAGVSVKITPQEEAKITENTVISASKKDKTIELIVAVTPAKIESGNDK